ncbi:MAG: phytanoyl-CoA dioxygenase family protein [Methylococcales bacterium]
MTIPNSAFSIDEVALDWARQHFSFSQHKMISEYPWGRIFELEGSSEKMHLKLIPFNPPQAIDNHAILFHHFQSTLPEAIAIDKEIGVQLFRHHEGIGFGYTASEAQKAKLLITYAKMQAKATEIPEILSSIPELQQNDIVNDFLEFLKPGTEDMMKRDKSLKADFFLGFEESAEYYDVFLARRELLDDFLNKAALLPPTLNHCDLYAENVLETDDGALIIDDWDKALIGPAGLSLAAFFGGCFKITQFLNPNFCPTQDEKFAQEKRLFNLYADELDRQGYGRLEILQKALPASACAGAIQTLLNYAHFPIKDDFYVFDVNEFFVRRLDDLLNLCDSLSCAKRSNIVHFAADYEEKNILFRAASLYRRYLQIHSNDFELHKRLASMLHRCGKRQEAIDRFQYIIEQDYGDADVFNDFGVTLLETSQPTDAIVNFELALSIDPDYQQARTNLNKATELVVMADEACHPNKVPTVLISSEERNQELFSAEKANAAYALFNQYGALVLESVFDVEMLQAINRLIFDKYAGYFEPKEYDAAFYSGDGHPRVVPNIEGPINEPNLYDNPFVSAIARRVLGDDYILGALNFEAYLPGAECQPIHQNYPPLFNGDDDFSANTSFALALLIPLVQDPPMRGSTKIIKESHKLPYFEALKLPGQTPSLDLGSALIVDYRTVLQNFSFSGDTVRPLLSLVFHRPWFRDCLNYRDEPSIQFDDALFYTAPERLKELIAWTKSESGSPIKLELVTP